MCDLRITSSNGATSASAPLMDALILGWLPSGLKPAGRLFDEVVARELIKDVVSAPVGKTSREGRWTSAAANAVHEIPPAV